MPHLLQLEADLVEVFPGLGRREAGLLEEVLAVRGDEDGVVLGHRAPDALHVRRLVARRDDLAVALLEVGDDVGDVDQLRLVEPGHVHPHLDQIVAGLRLHLRGVLGRLLRRGDVVDADLDAGVLRETRPDLGELLVQERREVVPAEVRDLTLLPTRGRYAGGEDSREARPGRGRQELSSGQ